MKTSVLTALAPLLMVTFAFAISFESTDTNHDGNITKDEFHGAAINDEVFSDWDTNEDALIDEDEYNDAQIEGDFDAWDVNNDSFLDESEFYDGTYDLFDEDGDSYWTANEWDDAVESGLFDV